jgi:hypothetical protein
MLVFGVTLSPGQPYTSTIPAISSLYITTVCVPPSSPKNSSGYLYFLKENKEKIILCYFDDKNRQFHSLNLFFQPHEQVCIGVEGFFLL